MTYKIVKLQPRTYERLDFYRNEDQNWDEVMHELLDAAGAWRLEDLLKESRQRLKEMREGKFVALDELRARLSKSRKKR